MSEDDGDWFERGVADDGEDSGESPDDEGPPNDDERSPDAGVSEAEEDWFESATRSDARESGADGASGPDADRESSGSGGEDGDGRDDGDGRTEDLGFEDLGRSGDDPAAKPSGNSPTEEEEELFEQDFASELGDVETPVPRNDPDLDEGRDAGMGGSGPSGARSGAGDFGMGGGGEDFGTGDAGDFGMGGDDGAAGDFGMGGGGFGMGGDDFEEDEFDSDIDRIDLGIEGLDEMIQGGVPRRTLMVAIGSAGTGKTTFGIQFLHEELRKEDGGNAVFITLEESSERIISSATEKGYPFDEYVADDRLAIVDMDPVEMANSLATIRSELPRLITEFNAERLVLDSVSLLEMMYDSRATRRNEIYDFTKSLKEAGVTTMLTSEASSSDPYTSRYGIVEYLTDAVFVLQYVRPSDFRKTRLAVEIQKIRDANHSRETKPYEITNSGISVYRQANIF